MKSIVIFVFVTCFSLYVVAGSYEAEAKATVKVVNENGKPISDAKVTFGYEHLKTMNPWDGRTDTSINGVTDSNGLML